MSLLKASQPRYSLTDLGFSNLLSKVPSLSDMTPEMTNNFTSGLSAKTLGAGEIGGLISFGHQSIVVPLGDDMQVAIEKVHQTGGGIVMLENGTHFPLADVVMYSDVTLIGQNLAIIDFNSQAFQIVAEGENVYATGTVTSITSGVFVTFSGTALLANVSEGQHLFIETRHYEIRAVTSNTTLVLSEGYGDDVSLPASYRISTIKQRFSIRNIKVVNSTTTGISFSDCRKVTLDNNISQDNNKGLVATYCSEFTNDRFLAVSCTDNGIELTNVGISDWESVNSISNGGHNFVFNVVREVTFIPVLSTDADDDGFNMTSCSGLVMIIGSMGNGRYGLHMVSGCDDNTIYSGPVTGNVSDNIRLTATSDNNKIFANTISGSVGGWGINILDSTSDNNTIDLNLFSGNALGAISDNGTGTIITAGNSGVDFQMRKEFVRMKNTSGGALAAGDLVILKSVAAGDEVTTTVTGGDDKVFGIAIEAISDTAYGRIQRLGKTTTLKVNGTTDIAVGDFLTAYTSAGIAAKAAAGDMVFAVALEAYATNDSSGVIDAILIEPKLI